MKYISLGAVVHPSTEHILNVSHCGFEYILTGEQAKLWLDGRFGFANSENPIEHRTVNHLRRMGLVMITNPYGAGEYRALTKCHIVPAEENNPYVGLNSDEKEVLMWLREAGLRLTMAELVFLRDRKIMPSLDLLGQEKDRSWSIKSTPGTTSLIIFLRTRWNCPRLTLVPSNWF